MPFFAGTFAEIETCRRTPARDRILRRNAACRDANRCRPRHRIRCKEPAGSGCRAAEGLDLRDDLRTARRGSVRPAAIDAIRSRSGSRTRRPAACLRTGQTERAGAEGLGYTEMSSCSIPGERSRQRSAGLLVPGLHLSNKVNCSDTQPPSVNEADISLRDAR